MVIDECELTILMPCLNEAETIVACVSKARKFLLQFDISGEVLIADNGSTDGSQALAVQHGAVVHPVPNRGYGAALLGGIAAARGRYIVMGDADDSYDFSNLMPFVERLREGNELVMGNRFRGGIEAGAMPFLHRYLGNPVLSGVGRLFFGGGIGDFHCGLRGFRRDSMIALNLQTTGMEFASEMIVKSLLSKLRIAEVPTILGKDGRSRPPHLRTWRDGWRHLRFLMLYSPRWLFTYPGIALAVIGASIMIWLLPSSKVLAQTTFDVHTMLFASAMIILGVQSVSFGLLTKAYATRHGLLPLDKRFESYLEKLQLERGLIVGLFAIALGVFGSLAALGLWRSADFGPLSVSETMRVVIPSVTCMIVGAQVMLGSLFLGVLNLRIKQLA